MNDILFILDTPIAFLNTNATKGAFHLNYPSGFAHWYLQNDADKMLISGNIIFPESVLKRWTTNDDPLIKYILEQQPWMAQ